MRRFWDDPAWGNATWYLETTGSYAEPNIAQYFEAGRTIVSDALDRAPVRPRRFERAVEIGPGLGRNCVALADRFEEVVGLDVSPDMVTRARGLVHHRRISYLTGDGFSLWPVADASVDLVLSYTVFQHIRKVGVIESYLREAARVLRPGGVVAFQWNSEPGPLHWRMRRALLAAVDRSGIRYEPYGRNPSELLGCRVPVDRVQLVLRSSGLSTARVRGEGTIFTWGWAQAP
ncbi:MAG TPA: class I SAM-dependent methyltransferase [Acidimicrobiales bacterium]|jgi:SAM-dependent methyltransferase